MKLKKLSKNWASQSQTRIVPLGRKGQTRQCLLAGLGQPVKAQINL